VTRGWLAPEFGESQIVSEDRGCRQNSRQTTYQRSRNVDACVGEELLWILNYEKFSWKFWVGSVSAEVRESLCGPVMNLLLGSGLVMLLMLFLWCVCTWCLFCQKARRVRGVWVLCGPSLFGDSDSFQVWTTVNHVNVYIPWFNLCITLVSIYINPSLFLVYAISFHHELNFVSSS
jgi:hypothetical protein